MKRFSIVIGVLGLMATLSPAPASAQFFDLRPGLTQEQFKEFTGELGSVLRARQLGDTTTLGKGNIDVNVQFASASVDDSRGAWTNTLSNPNAYDRLGRPMSFPRIVARFGVAERVDVGAWGAFETQQHFGMLGIDTTVALLRQGPTRPVSVSIRPSLMSLVGPSDLLAGNVSVDVSVSRAFGPWSPYAGLGASSSGALERSGNVKLNPTDAGESFAFAGLAFHWRGLNLSAAIEKGNRVNYTFGIGTRLLHRRVS